MNRTNLLYWLVIVTSLISTSLVCYSAAADSSEETPSKRATDGNLKTIAEKVTSSDSSDSSASPASSPGAANFSSQRLQNKTIVITGASSGFGRGVALKVASMGANVVLAARRAEILEKLARECGARTIFVTTDVTNSHDVEHLTQTAIAKFGSIDVWINDAGVGAVGRFVDTPLEDHARIVQTDLIGVIYGSHFALRQFMAQKHGTLINIASIVGEFPLAYYASYSSAKLGVVGLDRAIRAELKADKVKDINICTVLPMPSDTPFWNHAANYTSHTLQPPYLQAPQPTIDAIVKLVTKPKKNATVGTSAKLLIGMHHLNSQFMENGAAKMIRKRQMTETTTPAVNTDGSLLKPSQEGTTVDGGVAARFKIEHQQRFQEHLN